MVLSYYLLKYPYTVIYNLLKLLKINEHSAVYIGDELDYQVMQPVIRHLQNYKIVCKTRKLQQFLNQKGIKSKVMPCFAQRVLMCRLAGHKFPAAGQSRIGMRHGPYHFKAFSHKKNYLLFDKFLFTSEQEVKDAAAQGITNGVAIGYPRLDAAFNGDITAQTLQKYRTAAKIDRNKITLLFTATWEGSGLSAINKWYNKLDLLTKKYNILVSLHPWISEQYKGAIQSTGGVHLIEDDNTLPYIMIADICIGDASSMLAECCALDKKMITFGVGKGARIVPEVMSIIGNISIRIDEFAELELAIERYGVAPDLKQDERKKANEIFFCHLDGTAGKKAADLLKKEFKF